MYNRILVPIDMSSPETGARSCPVAENMAKLSGATINLMSVLPGYNFPLVASYFPADAQAKMKEQVLADMKSIASKFFEKEPELTIRTGKRSHEILQLAEEWKADLIVFGCRPKDALGGELMLGSCGITVSERAKCNVFIAR